MTRRAYLVALAAALALAAAAVVWIWTSNRIAGLAGEDVGTLLDPPVGVRDVRLVGADARTVTLGELAPTMLVFFGYTSCPDVCPLTLAKLSDAFDRAGLREDLAVAFVTVDARDTVEEADAYARGFHPAFRGYGGPSSLVADAAKRFFVGFQSLQDGTVAHTDAVFIVEDGLLTRLVTQDELDRFVTALAP